MNLSPLKKSIQLLTLLFILFSSSIVWAQSSGGSLIIRPLVPPVPTLISATSGVCDVTLEWSAVFPVGHYRVKWGTAPGVYDNDLNVGDVTTYTVEDLDPGVTYYFAVSAKKNGQESNPSNELSAVPLVPETAPTLFVENVIYNAAGQVTQIQYGNGATTTYQYDIMQRVERKTTTDQLGQAVQDLEYAYDSVGNILSITDYVNTATQDFVYDELGRLKNADNLAGYGSKVYDYDEIGNITLKDGKTYVYGEANAGPHAVTRIEDAVETLTYTYDDNGNMQTRQKGAELTEYIFDVENRLVQADRDSANIGLYEYDGDGGREKRIANGVVTHYVGSLFEENKNNGQPVSFVYLGDERVASIAKGKVMYHHADHLGGANVVTDESSTVKELIEYQPFGKIHRHEKYGSSDEIAHWYYTGQKKDDETGLYFYNARYYDPSLGKFLQPDLLVPRPSDPQSFNRYAMSGNNPVNHVDPSGHGWFKKFFGKIVSAIVGVAAFIGSGFNPVVGMQAYSITDSVISGTQAIINGANPLRILGSIGAGLAIGLGTADFIGGISNLGVRVGAFAVQGAAIGAAGAAITQGDIGLGAAFGAGTGATMGFLSSQQMTNYRNHGKFMSDKNFAKLNQRLSDLAQMAGVAGDANHSFELVSGQGELSSGITAGHTGMAVDGDAFGFYPEQQSGQLSWLFGKSGPGQIRAENAQFIQQAAYNQGIFGSRVNGFQANVALMQKYNPGTFSLATNCSRFALDTARMIGINVPSNLTTFGQTNPAKVAAWSRSISSWSADK